MRKCKNAKINAQKLHKVKKTTIKKQALEKRTSTAGELELMSTGT